MRFFKEVLVRIELFRQGGGSRDPELRSRIIWVALDHYLGGRPLREAVAWPLNLLEVMAVNNERKAFQPHPS